ncbi:MAG: DUF6475 domain-containing protein [Planctomycetota bacterium]
MDQNLFRESIAYLSVLFNYKLDPSRMDIYWQALRDCTDDEFKRMLKRIVVEFIPTAACPFPLPAHFMAGSGGTEEDKVDGAIARTVELCESVGRYNDAVIGDPALVATIESYGGWPEICSWSYDDWGFRGKEFKSRYKAYMHTEKKAGVLPGLESISAGKLISRRGSAESIGETIKQFGLQK